MDDDDHDGDGSDFATVVLVFKSKRGSLLIQLVEAFRREYKGVTHSEATNL